MSTQPPAPSGVSWWYGPTGRVVHFQGQLWPPLSEPGTNSAPPPEAEPHTWTWRNRGSRGTGDLTKVTQRRTALQH